MRRFTSFILSTASVGALAATPAFAQTSGQQQAAQQQNTAVDCASITDPQQHATCVQTQGQNAPATAGAPEAG